MSPEDIEKLINEKIRVHEFRVGIISGVIGSLFVFGLFHAIWLINSQL